MERSLKAILELNPKWIACGHDVPVKMSKARPVIEGYLNIL